MDELDERVWGIRFNPCDYRKGDLEAPAWVKDCENHLSYYSQGIVVWDENQKAVVNLSMWGAMDMLDHLTKTSLWKTQGQDVCQEYGKITPPAARGRRKKANAPDEAEAAQIENVIVRLHLEPDKVEKFLSVLKFHERKIRFEGDCQKRRFGEAINELVRLGMEHNARKQSPKEQRDSYDFSI